MHHSSVIGTVFLVFYTFPYLGILFAPLAIIYTFSAVYYRRTSVETKRLDSILRSQLYAAYTGRCYRNYGADLSFIPFMQSLSLVSVLSEHTVERYDAIHSDMKSSYT